MFTDPDGMKSVWNGQYGENSGYSDDKTGESRSWSEVQGEYGFGGDDKDKGKGDKSKNQISNYVNFNLNKLKNFANSLSNSLFEARNTNLIIYGTGKASDNFFSGEFKKGGKTVVMDLGKDNQIFWLMSIYAPARQADDGGASNLIDLFGDSHPMYSDKRFTKSDFYDGLVYSSAISKNKIIYGTNNVTEYYLPTTAYNVSRAESIYGYITISRKQAESGSYLKLIKK